MQYERRHDRTKWWLFWNLPRVQLVPSGMLVLQIGVRATWRDRVRPLERKLNEFVKRLFVVAEAKRAGRVAEARWRATFEDDAKREQVARASAERRARRVTKVRALLANWREANDVRELVAAARCALSVSNDTPEPKWIRWAERYAAQIDPVGHLLA